MTMRQVRSSSGSASVAFAALADLTAALRGRIPEVTGLEPGAVLRHLGSNGPAGAEPAYVVAGELDDSPITTPKAVLLPQPRQQHRLEDRKVGFGEPIQYFASQVVEIHPSDGRDFASQTRRIRRSRPFDPLVQFRGIARVGANRRPMGE